MKKIYCIILALVFFSASAQSENSDVVRLKRFFMNIAAYNNNYPQEKVYLHLDNNGYFPSEKIFFKAYVFRAGSLLPTDMSKILYVELLTPDGTVWDRLTLPIFNGRTYGSFDLSGIITSGFYEVRAYTRSMMNWDAAYAYSRAIPVFDIPKDTLNNLGLHLRPFDSELKYAMRRKLPEPLIQLDKKQVKKRTILNFYPEGGHIIKGLNNLIAYKITDDQGLPLDTTLTICTTEGKTISTTKPLHEGMGSFELPANWDGGYAQMTDKKGNTLKFNLPAMKDSGCRLHAQTMEDGQLGISIAPTNNYSHQLLGLTITCRGQLCYFDTLQIMGNHIVKNISRNHLRDGIQQVTLFTPEGEVLAERLVWVEPLQQPLFMEVRQNQEVYQPFSPIVLDLDLKDHVGKPLQGDFSISVQDRDGIINEGQAGLRTDMLLCSDLKGYIHHPDYYFENQDEQHRKSLDLLMMVQGWRRYEWKQMAGVDSFVIKQPIETRQIIDGRIINYSMKNPQPIPGMDVNLMIINQGKKWRTFSYASAVSDSLGRFAFAPKDSIYDDVLAYLSGTKKDKRQRCFIALNRNFKPWPRTFEPQELELKLPQDVRKQPDIIKPLETFEWKDTLPHIHYLPPARIKEKKRVKWDIPFGTRWTYMGGENYGAEFSTIYYNIEDELQDYLDRGDVVPNIFDWLKLVNKKVVYDRYTNTFEYDGHPVIFACDNQPTLPFNFTGDMSDFRSLFITKAPKAFHYLGYTGERAPSQLTYLFLFYSEVGNNFINTYKKGQRNTVIHGYSCVDDFYNPNYRGTDIPDINDRRRTLYWNPELETDKNGKANITLFSNFRKDEHLYIDVQGIAVNGEMFDANKK